MVMEAGGLRTRILLIDDDLGVRVSLGRALESESYSVDTAGDGPEALRKLDEGGIDLVLLDLTLPGMSGWDVFERINSLSPFLPIIIITARPDQYRLAAAAGVTAIMEKPLCLPRLMDAIRELTHETFERRVRRIIRNESLRLPSQL